MDFLKNLSGENKEGEHKPVTQTDKPAEEGGFLGKIGEMAGGKKAEPKQEESGFMDKLHGMVGGGKESEKNEDALDKGVDWVQENVLKQGKQDNESAIEQAKDEQISDFIRKQYKGTTGSDFPVKDKEH